MPDLAETQPCHRGGRTPRRYTREMLSSSDYEESKIKNRTGKVRIARVDGAERALDVVENIYDSDNSICTSPKVYPVASDFIIRTLN